MPASKTYNVWLVGSAVCMLGAWVALIVGTVTVAPLYKLPSPPPANQATPGYAGIGLAGPLADPLAMRSGSSPTFTRLRLSRRTNRGLFAGRGEPNARVVLLRAGRTLADTRANAIGDWHIATAIAKIAGYHEFALEQRGADGTYVVGESIRLHVPVAFRRAIYVTNSDSTSGFQLVAAQTDREDIGSASSRKFDELIRDGRIERGEPARKRVVAELNDDILAPAWSWLRDANRSYHSEVVPRIKRGGGYDQGGDGNRRRDTARRTVDEPDRRRSDRDGRSASDGRGDGTMWPGNGGSWVPTGIADWLTAAQRGYSSEIVPRLSGRVPSVIVARVRDDNKVQETAAERQRRLDRERNLERSATDKAEQERLNAARQRREAELRRQEAEEEARRLAEERRQAELDEARKIAAERRRVLERRAEEKRLAREAERRRDTQAEEQGRNERERELARAQEEAEKDALERQRRAEQAKENRETEEAERERKRLAQLNLQNREREREAAEQRQLEKERRDRLIAEAAAIKRRQADARLRAREDSIRRAERQREERRLEARRLADERRREANRLANERRERVVRAEARDRADALARATARERRESARRRSQNSQPTLPSKRPQRIAQLHLRDLNRFNRRDTEIEFKVNPRSSDRSRSTAGGGNQTRVAAKPKRRVAPNRRTKRTSKARRRRAVLAYRRRLAKAGGRRRRGRCHKTAGRRINPPGTYTVKRGDSLWRISKRHYRLGRYFRMIHRANKGKIRRARLIYPCQRFHLPRRRRT